MIRCAALAALLVLGLPVSGPLRDFGVDGSGTRFAFNGTADPC